MASDSNISFQPKPVLVLKTAEQTKAYFHRTRLDILTKLVEQPLTITQLATILGIHPANLTRHVKRLEAAGLILLVEKRDIGRTVEKYYRAAARSFDILPDPGTVDRPVAKVLGILRHDLTCAIRQLPMESEEPPAMGMIMQTQLTNAQFKKFATKLRDLIEEFKTANRPAGQKYTMNVSLYPGGADYGPTGEIHIERRNGT
jgi:DNA-binding transcriptional ArsR family regulator